MKRYYFHSKSSPGDRHMVEVNKKTGMVTCTCRGFRFNNKCWHRERVIDKLVERGYK